MSNPLNDFDPSTILTGPPVYVRKKFCYIGHATTTYSIDQAIAIIDYIGQKTESDDCLPFAVRLIEAGEMISVAEDNGEYACGEILTDCLKKMEGFNILVCVSRKVEGTFVTDMVQSQKHRAMKEAGSKVLNLLYANLTNGTKSRLNDDSLVFDADQININVDSIVPTKVIAPKTRERQQLNASSKQEKKKEVR